jgi:hypothetical protein
VAQAQLNLQVITDFKPLSRKPYYRQDGADPPPGRSPAGTAHLDDGVGESQLLLMHIAPAAQDMR